MINLQLNTLRSFVSQRPELAGFELFAGAHLVPDRTSVFITLIANRDLGSRHYRVVEEVPLDAFAVYGEENSRRMALKKLENDLAIAVAEYEAANPVEKN